MAKYRDRRIKASEETIAKSLEGDWRREHLFVLRVAWQNGQHVQEQIKKCDQELMEYTRQLKAQAPLSSSRFFSLPRVPLRSTLGFYEADFVKTRGENCFLFIFSSF